MYGQLYLEYRFFVASHHKHDKQTAGQFDVRWESADNSFINHIYTNLYSSEVLRLVQTLVLKAV